MLKLVCISFLALGAGLALLASAGLAAVILAVPSLPVVSFSAVILALAFASLAAMTGIIGLARLTPVLAEQPLQQNVAPDWRIVILHVSGLSAYAGIPLGHLLGPWILWLLWRHRANRIDADGQAALNFALTISIFYVSALILVFFFVGFLLLGIIAVFHIIVLTRNGWRASVNLPVHYPLSINFLG
tara:strand:+ start:318 stop:878 length:561 start_codon:yes stop_codon:yes gene_type:complete